jgi:tRNA (cytosine38-C5)-methyltransferase
MKAATSRKRLANYHSLISSLSNFNRQQDLRFFIELDLVGRDSRMSACFTKSYKRYFLGTGSVLIENHDMLPEFNDSQPESLKWVQEVLKPRFFTTREILRLMCFPESFVFPSGVTEKQSSALLGNSINIHVVALLIGLLIDK